MGPSVFFSFFCFRMRMPKNQYRFYIRKSIRDFPYMSGSAFQADILEVIPKKFKLLIRLFEPFGRSRVFYFSLRTFEIVEHHPELLEA